MAAQLVAAIDSQKSFSIDRAEKHRLVSLLGVDQVVEIVLQRMRDNDTPMTLPLCDVSQKDFDAAKRATLNAANRLDTSATTTSWQYANGRVSNGPLLQVSTAGLSMSTLLNGHERMLQPMSNKPSPQQLWIDDDKMRATFRHCLCVTNSDALSVNRLKVHTLLGNGCHYATAFPIPVAMFVMRWASRRLGNKALRVVDPCAGWGDRLAAASFVGRDIVESFTGMDPWHVSNRVCADIMARLCDPVVSILERTRAEVPWPPNLTADLVFTSPPYFNMEKYNYDGDNRDDGQAWRHAKLEEFVDLFLKPLMINAANALSPDGLVVININDNTKIRGLVDGLLKSASAAGLSQVHLFGMSLSVERQKQHSLAENLRHCDAQSRCLYLRRSLLPRRRRRLHSLQP